MQLQVEQFLDGVWVLVPHLAASLYGVVAPYPIPTQVCMEMAPARAYPILHDFVWAMVFIPHPDTSLYGDLLLVPHLERVCIETCNSYPIL